LFAAFGSSWLSGLSRPALFALVSAWLFAIILMTCFAGVRHAEAIAVRLAEPLGTLVLTLAVTGIEVTLIAAVMYAGKGNAALASDPMFAVVMIVLTGMVGLWLVVGGLPVPRLCHADLWKVVRRAQLKVNLESDPRQPEGVACVTQGTKRPSLA